MGARRFGRIESTWFLPGDLGRCRVRLRSNLREPSRRRCRHRVLPLLVGVDEPRATARVLDALVGTEARQQVEQLEALLALLVQALDVGRGLVLDNGEGLASS